MYSDMSTRIIARSSSNRKSASVRASSVLPTPVGPRNRNEPIGRCGSDSPARDRRIALATAATADVLTDDALVEHLFEPHELRQLAFHQPGHGDAGPFGDDLGDVLLVDLFLQHGAVALQLAEPLRHRVDLTLDHRNVAVAELGRALEIAVALGALGVEARLLQPFLAGLDRRDRVLLRLPVRDHAVAVLLQRLELCLQQVETLLARVVGFLGERGPLDLELADAPLDDVDLERHRIDLDAQARGGFVDEVDRLVGKLAAADVPVGEHGRGNERGVLDPHAVVHLVALLQAAQDRDRVLDRRLTHVDRLEAPLEGGVLLDVLAVLVERGRADQTQLTAGEHRLDHVAGVDRAFGAARADDRVQLVDEGDHLTLASLRSP